MSSVAEPKLEVKLQASIAGFDLHADFVTHAAGITAIYGSSGAGKTSLLRAIAGLLPSQGVIRIGTRCWQDDSRWLPAHERPGGFVFQHGELFSHLSVQRNLEFGMRRRSTPGLALPFEKIIGLLQLKNLLSRSVDELSGGERQRVAIGRALLSSPELLLMDEPMASLDTSQKRELMTYLESLHEELGLPVLYVSHSTEEVARLADNLVLLEQGNTVASGPTPEMLTRFDLPLSRDHDSAAVITAVFAAYDSEFDLSRLEHNGCPLYVPGNLLTANKQPLRLRILARDVSLTTQRQNNTSILNILPVKVLEVSIDSEAQCLVRLASGDAMLLARITRKSAAALQVESGQHLYAQIKSVALL